MSDFVHVSASGDFWNKLINHPTMKEVIYKWKYKLLAKKTKRKVATMRKVK